MNIDILNEAIGGIDAYIVEEALADGEKKPKVTAFAQRPWMKWAAAAVAIVVIAAGTPLALKAIGSFRNENFVAPNGSGNSGIVPPVDSSESESGEPESGSEPESENNASSEQSGESRSRGSEAPGGSSSDTPYEPVSSSETSGGSSSGTADSDSPSGAPEGEFIKDNMPAATYKINGEIRSFVYQKSSVVKIDGEAGYRVFDHYADADGATISTNADSGELVEYQLGDSNIVVDWMISENEAIAIAKRIVINTDIEMEGLENASADVRYTDDRYYVVLTTVDGNVETCLDTAGGLLLLSVIKVSDNSGL